jgi:hypothetical protein
MDYEKKIRAYRKTADVRLLKFIDFLQTLIEWKERLYELKRISVKATDKIDKAFPRLIFHQLDKLGGMPIKQGTYDKLKKLLLGETTRFVHTVITFGDIQLHDFDLLQFNLYQIFGKEELASMVEWSRVHLQEELESRKKQTEQQKQKKKKKEERDLAYVRSLSQKELNRRAIKIMFDFTPSARTDDERIKATITHRKKILGHRQTFHLFEEKLLEATEEARKQSELSVYQRMGTVRRHMDSVALRFRKKAAEFASAEGPRKKIEKARANIDQQSKTLRTQMLEAGEQWETQFAQNVQHSQDILVRRRLALEQRIVAKGRKWSEDFLIDVASARDRISTEAQRLNINVAKKGIGWKKAFEKEIFTAQKEIDYEREKLDVDTRQRKKSIHEHGIHELDTALGKLQYHKDIFSSDILGARDKFSAKRPVFEKKRKEMDMAKISFKDKLHVAGQTFIDRGDEIEQSMTKTITREKKQFIAARNRARTKFINRAAEIGGTASQYILKKKEAFQTQYTNAGISATQTTEPKKAGEKMSKAVQSMSAAHIKVMEEGKRRRLLMQDRMKKQRDLFQYDVRFAQHRISRNAERFADKAAEKQEEFVARGKQLVARHKAHQKANLIQNLLRTIRSSH